MEKLNVYYHQPSGMVLVKKSDFENHINLLSPILCTPFSVNVYCIAYSTDTGLMVVG